MPRRLATYSSFLNAELVEDLAGVQGLQLLGIGFAVPDAARAGALGGADGFVARLGNNVGEEASPAAGVCGRDRAAWLPPRKQNDYSSKMRIRFCENLLLRPYC